jgi:mannosyltransferase OCH1-like enzyme
VRYEIDRLRPNYGASSDLLRYLILYSFGGAYFDSDVAPGTKRLETSESFLKDFDNPIIYINKNSQNTKEIGNDAFIQLQIIQFSMSFTKQQLNTIISTKAI